VRRHLPERPRRRRTTRSKGRRLRLVLASGLLAGGLSACSAGSNEFSGPAPQKSGPSVTYVSVTESEPAQPGDVRVSWPMLFYRSALPSWATAYELSVPSGWQFNESPLISQLLALRPTVVTVELGLDEVFGGVGVSEFSASLSQLLTALHTDGVPTVLVANILPLPGSQAGASGVTGLIAAYNAAIAADSAAEGAVLVDAHGTFARALQAGEGVMAFGSSLTPLGETLMARTFDAGARHRPLWRPPDRRS